MILRHNIVYMLIFCWQTSVSAFEEKRRNVRWPRRLPLHDAVLASANI